MKKLLSLILAITMIAAFIPTAFAADGDTTMVTYTYAFNNGSWFEQGYNDPQKREMKNKAFSTEALTDTEWAYLGSGTMNTVENAKTASTTKYNMVVGNFGPSDKKDATRAVAAAAGEWLAFKVEVPMNGKYAVDVKSYLYKDATSDMDVYLLPSQTQVEVGGYTGVLEGAFADSRVYGTYKEVASTANGSTTYTGIRENAKKFSDFSFTSINADDYKAIDSANTYKFQGTSAAYAEGVQSITGTAAKELSLDAGVYVLLLCTNEGKAINISTLTLTKQEEEPDEPDEPVVPDEPEDPIVPEVSYNATVPVTYTLSNVGRGVANEPGYFEQAEDDGKGKWEKSHTEFTASTDPNHAWAYIGTSTLIPYTTGKLIAVGNYNSAKGGATRVKIDAVNGWIAFQIKVPETGIYKVTEMEAFLNSSSTSDMDMYILPANAQVTVNGFSGNLLNAFSDEKVYGTFTTADDSITRSGSQTFDKFVFDALETENYKVVDSANLYNRSIGASAAECGNVPFTAGREVVLTADTPYVLLFCTNEANKQINIHSVTLAPVIELIGNITFGAGAAIEYKKTTDTEFKSLAANGVDSTSFVAGDSVTVKVTDTTNFAGWVRGTADSGVWVSSDPEYKFNIISPTYLIPIYTTPEESATHAVEFWDENGAYVDTITATDGKAVLPTSGCGVVGGELNGWWLNETTKLLAGDDVAEGITRAVAQYNYGDFGKGIFNSDDSAKYWKRGDDIVAYGNTYNFYQWDGAEDITFGAEEIEKNPLVVLDSTPVDGAYMIEYDKGNASEIVEAGILFGSTAEIHISSTDGSKAASQRNGVDDGINDGHGQFCAKPNTESNYNYARGYLIYKGTDSKLYVIYTAAVATASAQ